MKRIIMAAMIVSLAACGGDKDDVATEQQQEWESQKQSLVYSFPDNNQQEVPVPSPVVLRFSSPVMETSPAVVLREVGGPVVSDFEMEWVDGKRGLIITPDGKLKPMTDYVVQVPAIELEKGVAPAKNIRFSTRALFEGPKSLVASDTFEVTRMIPDGENYQVMDFSSFRVQFSQPLDQTTVKYGDGADATVQLMGPEGVVDAHLLVSGHYMTIDPKEDLTPGAEYSLNMTTGITSTYGETLPGGSFGNPGDTLAVSVKVSPQDTKAPGTGLRVSMVQDVADTGELSPLTGQPINLVPMASVLLGEDTATQASGTVAAELAFVPNFPEATPFRVKRGSLIEGASIEVLIGGKVPAGFESGKVRMDFLSDATGYLLPNPYSNSDDAPRQVRLFMDVAVSTETPSANGAITQDLLHIELVGTSIVEDGVMVINAVGVVEPDVLGSERAKGILSFYMKAYEDQDNPPSIIEGDLPIVQSWVPGEDIGSFNESDPIIINFSNPIDRSSIKSGIIIKEDGINVEYYYTVDGSSVVIRPKNGLQRGVNYEVWVGEQLFDINGVKVSEGKIGNFNLIEHAALNLVENINQDISTYEEISPIHSAVVLSMYPGFPCAINSSEVDLQGGTVGRCTGGMSGWEDGSEGDRRKPDDILPLPYLPENKPIIINFSKKIDPSSVIAGETFSVYRVGNDKSILEEVNGILKLDNNKIEFWPNEPWKVDEYYKYTISSNGDRFSSNAECGISAICDMDGLPLQTVLWEIVTNPIPSTYGRSYVTEHIPSEVTGGGIDMDQFFKASPASDFVLQNFSARSADRNANFVLDKVDSERDEDMWVNFPPLDKLGFSYINDILDGEPEVGAENQAKISDIDPALYPGSAREDIDPEGVVPPINSVKLLSMMIETDSVTLEDLFVNGGAKIYALGMDIGCGYEDILPPDSENFFGKHVPKSSPCPHEKFSYLNSSIIAEVTDEFVEGKGIKVKLWPGQIIGTSISQRIASGKGVAYVPSGMQVMRMRYGKDDPECIDTETENCLRSQPIFAWIKESNNGDPVLSALLDLYIDAPFLNDNIGNNLRIGDQNQEHNLVSYPVTMEISGKIHFNDDGTMLVEQYNVEDVDISFQLSMKGAKINDIAIKIPAYGSRIVYESEIIK